MPFDGDMYFLILSCADDKQEINADYHFTNPGGEELSAGLIPMKQAAVAFVGEGDAGLLLLRWLDEGNALVCSTKLFNLWVPPSRLLGSIRWHPGRIFGICRGLRISSAWRRR